MHHMNPVTYFFAHTDALGATLFCLLVLMSLASWFCIAAKSLRFWRIARDGARFRQEFWRSPMPASQPGNPFSRLAEASISVHRNVRDTRSDGDELLLRCMQRVVGEEGARLDNGQTLLASIAAVAPFVGLFGTVWGVQHALSAIGTAGAASLEQIAGPVGEALIMTALGLAVAIPAVLAYNMFSRSSQTLLAKLDGFAHELHHYLITGQALPITVRGA
jgi:biopolymer transport protein ExbB